MTTIGGRRSAASVALLLDLAADHSVPAPRLLDGTGLAAAGLPEEIGRSQELAVVRNLLAACDVPGLGLAAGSRYHFTTYGVWGLALVSSPTLRSAIALALRYLDLSYAFCPMSFEEGPERSRFTLADPDVPPDVRAFLLERDTAAAVTLLTEMLGTTDALLELHMSLPEPAHADLYAGTFAAKPTFSAARTHAVLDSRWLDRPLPAASPWTARACEQQCRELLARRNSRNGLAGQVRDALLATPGWAARPEEVGARLGMSTRTLRRRLAAEGLSYRSLLDEVRQGLAEEFLRAGLTVEETARRLGYAEAASFNHAFRRWKGLPPGRYARTR